MQVDLVDINKLLPYVLFNRLNKFVFNCDFCVYLQGV